MPTYHLTNDAYRRARGGEAHFLDLYCARCGSHLLLYQKDGFGPLLRLYRDRIVDSRKPISAKGALRCATCNEMMGTPMIYAKESRPAFHLVPGATAKRRSSGSFPPKNTTIPVAPLSGGINPAHG
jgi:hypothetical protein